MYVACQGKYTFYPDNCNKCHRYFQDCDGAMLEEDMTQAMIDADIGADEYRKKDRC